MDAFKQCGDGNSEEEPEIGGGENCVWINLELMAPLIGKAVESPAILN